LWIQCKNGIEVAGMKLMCKTRACLGACGFSVRMPLKL
jgi:hypothetical protein